jgi:hypothetical protein
MSSNFFNDVRGLEQRLKAVEGLQIEVYVQADVSYLQDGSSYSCMDSQGSTLVAGVARSLQSHADTYPAGLGGERALVINTSSRGWVIIAII